MSDSDLYDIRVKALAQYIAAESNPEEERYIFAYTITIKNHGQIPAKLLTRHWIITDANSRVQEVRGKGVIGEHPHLQQDESFQYTSGTMINTPVGTMQGSFQMIADDDYKFDAMIDPFTLAMPGTLN